MNKNFFLFLLLVLFSYIGKSQTIKGVVIDKKTKAIFVVHYGGNCIDLKKIIQLKKKYNLYLVEDTAHSFLE